MEIKVRTNISKEYQDIEININCPEKNEQITTIENFLLNMSNTELTEIIGYKNNDLFIINIQSVIEFYTDERNIFCKTLDGDFQIKEKLYWLEDNLPSKDFIRISNSVIININHVKCFNTSIIGKIVVKFNNGLEEAVAKRKTSEIMKFLKERKNK